MEQELNKLSAEELAEVNPASELGTSKISAIPESNHEVSAQTVGRMLGLATVTEVRLIEDKLDLITTKLNAIQLKIDKVAAASNTVCTGSDLDRIEIQISALKNVLRDLLPNAKDFISSAQATTAAAAPEAGAQAPSSDVARKRPNIFLSKPTEGSK
jgi:hypothetical protein